LYIHGAQKKSKQKKRAFAPQKKLPYFYCGRPPSMAAGLFPLATSKFIKAL